MNLSELCRICTQNDFRMHLIAESITPAMNVTCSSVVELFNIFSKLLVSQNDGLPDHICEKCLQSIHQAYNFLGQCETSRIHLIQIKDTLFQEKEPEILQESAQVKEVCVKEEVKDFLLEEDKGLVQAIEPNVFEVVVSAAISEPTVLDVRLPQAVPEQLENPEETDIFEENGDVYGDGNDVVDDNTDDEDDDDEDDDDEEDEEWQPATKLLERVDDTRAVIDSSEEGTKTRRGRRKRIPDEDIESAEKPRCEICDKEFDKKSRLARHMKTHISGRKRKKEPMECKVCNKTFEKKSRLVRHMNVHDPDGRPFECEICKVRFVHESNMRRHAITHTEVISESSTILRHQTVFKCIECPKEFAKQESLASHMRTHRSKGERKQYTCEVCSKVYPQLNLLTRHMKSHEEYRNYQCNICGKRFALTSRLIDHINRHNGIKPHVCHFCNKAFLQSCTLKDHLRTHTGEQPYLCAQCGKAFNNGSNLRQHLLRHTGIKPFACPECPSRFACKGELKGHMTTHQNLKPYSCDQCDSKFTKPQSLKKHMRIHTGERPYACEACGMTFTSSYPLKRHMRTHTGEKPYHCKFCDRSFAQSNDLVKHTRSHVGENTYQCEECPAAFRLHNELRAHIQDHFRERNERKDLDEDLKAALTKQKAAAESGKFMSAKMTTPATGSSVPIVEIVGSATETVEVMPIEMIDIKQLDEEIEQNTTDYSTVA